MTKIVPLLKPSQILELPLNKILMFCIPNCAPCMALEVALETYPESNLIYKITRTPRIRWIRKICEQAEISTYPTLISYAGTYECDRSERAQLTDYLAMRQKLKMSG